MLASPSIPRRKSVYPQAMYTGQLHPKSFSMISKFPVYPGSSVCLLQGIPQPLLLTGILLLPHLCSGLFVSHGESRQSLYVLLQISSAGIVFSANNNMSSPKSHFPCTTHGHSFHCCGILRSVPPIILPVELRLMSANNVP